MRFIFYSYSIFIIGLMCVFTITEFLDMVLNFEDIYKMTFALCYFVTHILGTVKMFLMIALRKKLWNHLKTLEEGIFKPNIQRGGINEIDFVKDAIQLCKRQARICIPKKRSITFSRTLYAALANLPYDKHNYVEGNVTIVVNTKIMPYTTWMPFDYNDSPLYELVFAFQIFSTVVYGYYIGATDAVICGFMMLIKAQFLIVKRELETLIERAQQATKLESKLETLINRAEQGAQVEANPESNTDIKSYSPEGIDRIQLLNERTQYFAEKNANEAVFHHQELIALCDHAEEDFCYLMLLQFLSSLLIVCFQLFQLSTLSPDSVEFFSMSMYLVLMLFQLLCYCWHGNEVQIVSGEVSSYVFNINWIIMKESIKKSLILIMMRSQRPCYFTAGKFSLLSLQTFMTIVRGAASYFMFLRQMNV
ncbi:unnamed protein product [Tenebrio molitor]|nr:unnamed protein product [Tenebrio molitor]